MRRFSAILTVHCLLLLGAACQKPTPPTEVIFWTTEVEQDRMQVQMELARRFNTAHPGVTVKIVPVDENVQPEKLAAARAADQLPDVVELGLTQVVQYANQGLLDAAVATRVVEDLGVEGFYSGPLRLCRNPAGDGYAAVPIDGWVQGIWYRRDWFTERGLPPPDSWDAVRTAARAFHDPPNARFGIVVGTHPQQMFTQQVFEQFALSNGARLFSSDGTFTGRAEPMARAVAYYADLARLGPPGHNYWREARQYYLTGRVAMMFYSPYIIDDIAGLVADHQPTEVDLARKTGFAPTLRGPGGRAASYGEVYALGITVGADPAARDWLAFLLGEGYGDWLSMSPGGKIPVRKAAVEQWRRHPYFEHYQPGLAQALADGMERLERWGYFDGAAVPKIGDVYATKVVPEMLGRVLDRGETPEQALVWLADRVEGL